MKLAKSLAIIAMVACSFNAQPAHSSDFVKNLLQQFSGTIVSWDDLESRHQALEVQIRQALEAGNITLSDADHLRLQLNPVSEAVIQGRASGRPLSFTQGLAYAQTINGVTAALQQAMATKQSTLPDIDALQGELAQKIDESLNANQLTQDDAIKLKGELRTVADIESTIKSSGDGSLSAKQIETISGRLSDIKTQLVQAIKMGQSAIPELTHRLSELQSRINGALSAGQINNEQTRHLMGGLDRSGAQMKSYLNSSQYLNGRQILELAGDLDHVSNDLQSAISANQIASQAASQAANQAPSIAVVQPQPNQTNYNAINVTDLSSESEQGNAKKYPDVVGYWGEPYISILASRGIIGGFPDGTFHPNDNITRAQFAAIAVKALNVPPNSGASSFNDVAAKYWGANAISAVSNAGLVTGFPDGTFKPEDKLTRAQALVILAKALGSGYSEARELSNYSDAQTVPNWALPSVTRAASAHIIANFPDPSLINPNAFATRGEVAALMYQTLLALHRHLPNIRIGLLPQFAGAPAAVVPARPVQIVQPAVQQPQILTIENVEVSPAGKLSAGDVLTVRAFGTPNAQASFSIKDGVQDVQMDERRQGVYEGSYTVRKTDNIGRTRVYVSLNKRGAQPASGESRADFMLDAMPPEIMVEPRPNTVAQGGQPNIVVKFTDGHGSGVDPASVHLLIDGHDVTPQAILDGGMIAFRPGQPLAGMVHAEIKLADRCGNAVDYTWTFETQPAGPGR
jgi:hypothetical protein